MKRSIIVAVLAMMCIGAFAQEVKKNAQGVYVSVKAKATTEDKKTGEFYQDSKGVKYPIYVSAGGKYYIIRVSKNTGKEYKQYLKLN